MSNHPVDVLLTDIEMPFETGLELISWVRSKEYKTRCILLTAHPDFAYAKEAIHLDVTDYVVQPAPYHEIVAAVKKAIKELNDRHNQEEEDEMTLASYALSNFLRNGSMSQYQKLLKDNTEYLPKNGEQCSLALIQILRWEIQFNFSEDDLYYAINNIINDLFGAYGQKTLLCELEKDLYACLIYTDIQLQNIDFINHQYEFLSTILKNHFHCEIAVYLKSPITVENLHVSYQELLQLKENNLARKSRVRMIKEGMDQDYTYRISSSIFKEYETLFKEGKSQDVQQLCVDYFHQLEQKDQLNQKVLYGFLQDFMETLNNISEDTGINTRSLFEENAAFSLYKKATASLDDMFSFIRYVCDRYDSKENDLDAESMVTKAKNYIDANLGRDLKRDVIAEQIHISSGYLSRIFKEVEGISMKEYIINERMKMAKHLLVSTSLPVSVVAAKIGYHNFSQFSQTYKEVNGVLPSSERKEG